MEPLEVSGQVALDQIFVPGRLVDVVPRRTEVLNGKQVRHAMVLGMREGDLVLSLPDPPLSTPLVGQALEITFLSQGAQQPERYGYFTLVLDTLEHYRSDTVSQSGLVVLFPHQEDIIPTNLRSEKRYKVGRRNALGIKVPGLDSLILEDISLRGLRFKYLTCAKQIQDGQNLELMLNINKQSHRLKGQVVECRALSSGGQVRMELDSLPLDLWSNLLQILHDLDRTGKAAVA